MSEPPTDHLTDDIEPPTDHLTDDVEQPTDPLTDDVEPPNSRVERPRRQIHPVSLVIGIIYVATGVGVLVERQWGGIDSAAIAGTGAIIAGLAVIFLIARR